MPRKYANVDNIPALLSQHEMVVNNEGADILGRKNIVKANQLGLKARKYANGTLDDLGIQRVGNSYSAKGARPIQTTGITSAPTPRTLPQGVQRVGNAYSAVGRPAPALQGLSTQPYGHPLPSGIQRTGDSYTDDYSGNFNGGARNPFVDSAGGEVQGETDPYGNPYGYQDGTLEETGLQPPDFMESVRRLIASYDQPPDPEPIRQDSQPTAPTLEQSRRNYELRTRGYADGTTDEYGIGGKYYNPDRELQVKQAMARTPFVRNPVAPPSIGGAIGDAGSYAMDNIGRSAQMVRGLAADAGNTLSRQASTIGDSFSRPALASTAPQGAKPPPLASQPVDPTFRFDDGQGGHGAVRRSNGIPLNPSDAEGLQARIAYNATPEAKARFAEQAALTQARVAARQPDLAAQQREMLMRQALTVPDPSTMGIGEFIKTQNQQHAAQKALGIGQGQQKLDSDIAAGKASGQYTQAKDARDYALELEKANKPIALDTYDEAGQKTGQELVDVQKDKQGNRVARKLASGNSEQDNYLNALKAASQIDESPEENAARIKAITDRYRSGSKAK